MKFYVKECPEHPGRVFVREEHTDGNICEVFAWGKVSAKDNAQVVATGLTVMSKYAEETLIKRKLAQLLKEALGEEGKADEEA